MKTYVQLTRCLSKLICKKLVRTWPILSLIIYSLYRSYYYYMNPFIRKKLKKYYEQKLNFPLNELWSLHDVAKYTQKKMKDKNLICADFYFFDNLILQVCSSKRISYQLWTYRKSLMLNFMSKNVFFAFFGWTNRVRMLSVGCTARKSLI